MRRRFNYGVWCLALLTVSSAAAQDSAKTADEHSWRGAWAASAGSRTLHGRWWAQLLAQSPNAGSGSWTLLSDSNQIVLEGTWSARKSLHSWQGAWTARLNSGRAFSGTWTSDMTEGKTFQDMLQQTLEKQVTGSWRSGRMQGNWWLMGQG
jgi:hypothetical protein